MIAAAAVAHRGMMGGEEEGGDALPSFTLSVHHLACLKVLNAQRTLKDEGGTINMCIYRAGAPA